MAARKPAKPVTATPATANPEIQPAAPDSVELGAVAPSSETAPAATVTPTTESNGDSAQPLPPTSEPGAADESAAALAALTAEAMKANPSLAGVVEMAAELAGEVLTERLRQILEEGRGAEQDDAYTDYQLARAAVCYAIRGAHLAPHKAALYWPWNPAAFKPTGTDRDLIKAAALILAELQRRQRARAEA